MPKISIVSPVYGCKSCLNDLYARLLITLEKITPDFEIILVNDAGPDKAWPLIKELCEKDNRVKGIDFARNFGQHYAITAGLDYAAGDWVVVMDCDLQDQPEEILKLYAKAQEGNQVVFGQRISRQDSFLKKMSSRIFYLIFNYFTETKFDHTIANFGIYSQKVITNFRLLKEQNRSFPLFIQWLGFNPVFVEIEHSSRQDGNSSYTLGKLINLAIDVIVAQSNKPLKLSIQFGLLISFFSFLLGIYFLIKHFILEIAVPGWTSIIVSLFFVSGLIFANLGLLGLYIGKIFNETKGRPLYVVRDTINI